VLNSPSGVIHIEMWDKDTFTPDDFLYSLPISLHESCHLTLNATQRNATQRNATQRNATQRNATQRNATQRNATQRNATQRPG
jgi:hypothetical protein